MIKQNILFICMMFPVFLLAQKKNKDQYVCKYVEQIIVDGDLNDWTTNLYNTESTLWNFGIVISDTKLFAAVIVKDKKLIEEAVHSGIFLNISYSDKKKQGAQLLFPRVNLEKLERLNTDDDMNKEFSNEQLIRSSKGYHVAGFNSIVDGLLSFDNTYGIHATCKIGDNGELIYEAEIPLSLIKFQTKDIAVQLAINTRYSQFKGLLADKKSTSSRGANGRKTSSTTIKNPYTESTSVWFVGVIR